MPEPTDPLSHFDPEIPMPLSAASIRRRGDRLRRRTIGLAVVTGVAVIAVAAAPLALLTGGRDDAVEPSNPSTSVPASLVTEIPDDFPLSAGYPTTNEDLTPVAVDDQAVTTDFDLCLGQRFDPDTTALTDVAGVEFSAPEDTRARMLSVWQDEQSAMAALASVRDVLGSCTPGGLVVTERSSPYGGDSAVYTVQAGPVVNPGALGLDVYEAVRVRNVVYLSHSSGEGGGSAEAARAGVRRAAEASADVVAATYDVFAGTPTPDLPVPAADLPGPAADLPGPADPGTDLASFPLALDWPDPSDVEAGSPGLQGPALGADQNSYQACGETWESPQVEGILHATYGNTVDLRSRELLTFADAREAVAFMARVRDLYTACPTEPGAEPGSTRRHEVRDTELGGESFAVADSTTVGRAEVPGLAVSAYIRLGRAVLVDTTSDEAVRSDAPAVIEAMSLATANVVAEMCVFTEAGC